MAAAPSPAWSDGLSHSDGQDGSASEAMGKANGQVWVLPGSWAEQHTWPCRVWAFGAQRTQRTREPSAEAPPGSWGLTARLLEPHLPDEEEQKRILAGARLLRIRL